MTSSNIDRSDPAAPHAGAVDDARLVVSSQNPNPGPAGQYILKARLEGMTLRDIIEHLWTAAPLRADKGR